MYPIVQVCMIVVIFIVIFCFKDEDNIKSNSRREKGSRSGAVNKALEERYDKLEKEILEEIYEDGRQK